MDLNEFKDAIEFKDVTFQYEENEQTALNDVNLKFKKNGKYLIVGSSGGGKSTLLKLLRKYFNPTNGIILIDGQNLKDVKREDKHMYDHIINVKKKVMYD